MFVRDLRICGFGEDVPRPLFCLISKVEAFKSISTVHPVAKAAALEHCHKPEEEVGTEKAHWKHAVTRLTAASTSARVGARTYHLQEG